MRIVQALSGALLMVMIYVISTSDVSDDLKVLSIGLALVFAMAILVSIRYVKKSITRRVMYFDCLLILTMAVLFVLNYIFSLGGRLLHFGLLYLLLFFVGNVLIARKAS